MLVAVVSQYHSQLEILAGKVSTHVSRKHPAMEKKRQNLQLGTGLLGRL